MLPKEYKTLSFDAVLGSDKDGNTRLGIFYPSFSFAYKSSSIMKRSDDCSLQVKRRLSEVADIFGVIPRIAEMQGADPANARTLLFLLFFAHFHFVRPLFRKTSDQLARKMDIFSPNFSNKSGQKHKSGRKVGSKKPSNLGLFRASAHFPTFFLIICVNKIFIIFILIGV